MRAPKLCSEPGCIENAAQKSGKCERHSEKAWVRSTRETSKEWPRVRKRVLVRDRRRCLFCGQPSNIVDHRLPTTWGGLDELENLQTMCAEDHRVKTIEEARLGRRLKDGSADEKEVRRHVLRWTPDRSLWGLS